MKRGFVHFFAVLLAVCMLLTAFPLSAAADEPRTYTLEELEETIRGIAAWKKQSLGAAEDASMFTPTYLSAAGTGGSDWYPIGMSRAGLEEDYDAYLAVLADSVTRRYQSGNGLDDTRATEWHRIILTVLACGGDPTAFGTDANNQPINLVADGTYNRGKTASLGKQGMNGWTWGLIALDSMRYEIPEGSYYSRGDIITEILKTQLDDGGFDFSNHSADPDMTAMTLQALSPYYTSDTEYTYVRNGHTEEETKTVRQVIDEGLAVLSSMQQDNGGYSSWGVENVESADQVVTALCCLGIDPQTDERFIKNGHTMLEFIMSFQMEDGGFLHARIYQADNPTSLPTESNSMASEQTLYTLAAVRRQMLGLNALYDFREEGSDKTSPDSPDAQLTPSVHTPEEIAQIVYTPAERDEAKKLCEQETSTENYAAVVMMLAKLKQSADFEDKDACIAQLEEKRQEILDLEAEIKDINNEIKDKLYPFESITISDFATVNKIVSRYEALPEYDRQQIELWEDVVRAKTQVDNLIRAVVIGVVLLVIAIAVVVYLKKRAAARIGKKKHDMEELAEQYKDEDV